MYTYLSVGVRSRYYQIFWDGVIYLPMGLRSALGAPLREQKEQEARLGLTRMASEESLLASPLNSHRQGCGRHAIATMTRTLCTQYIDPMTIEPPVANRLIPLDKGEGAVRPIGVGEVSRRTCGKYVMNVVKKDVVDASGSLQLCAGQKSGSEAAIHAMHTIFESDDTDAVLLIDASNAFNALNRAAALHNIRILCPIIAI